MASAAVVSSKKRHQSFAGHEHSVAMGKVAEVVGAKMRSRFDKDRFELWRSKDRHGGAIETTSLGATGVGHAGSTSAAGENMRRFESFRADYLCSKAGFRHALADSRSCRHKQDVRARYRLNGHLASLRQKIDCVPQPAVIGHSRTPFPRRDNWWALCSVSCQNAGTANGVCWP